MVIIVFGLPGSGKTYFAKKLAARLGTSYISTDILRKKMFVAPCYTQEEKQKVYEAMVSRAEKCIINGRDVILDGNFYSNSLRNETLTILKDFTDIFFIEVVANEDVITTRLSKPRQYSDADVTVYQKIKAEWQPLRQDHLIVDSTDNDVDKMINSTLEFLQHHDINTN